MCLSIGLMESNDDLMGDYPNEEEWQMKLRCMNPYGPPSHRPLSNHQLACCRTSTASIGSTLASTSPNLDTIHLEKYR